MNIIKFYKFRRKLSKVISYKVEDGDNRLTDALLLTKRANPMNMLYLFLVLKAYYDLAFQYCVLIKNIADCEEQVDKYINHVIFDNIINDLTFSLAVKCILKTGFN